MASVTKDWVRTVRVITDPETHEEFEIKVYHPEALGWKRVEHDKYQVWESPEGRWHAWPKSAKVEIEVAEGLEEWLRRGAKRTSQPSSPEPPESEPSGQ